MSALLLLLALALSWPGLPRAQKVSQPAGEAKAKEGENVTLECRYDSGFPTLLWYRQEPHGAPQFILYEGSRPEDLAERFRNRFRAKMNTTSRVFPLEITSARLSDSATYYCVLRDTLQQAIGLSLQNPSLQSVKNPALRTSAKLCLVYTGK